MSSTLNSESYYFLTKLITEKCKQSKFCNFDIAKNDLFALVYISNLK